MELYLYLSACNFTRGDEFKFNPANSNQSSAEMLSLLLIGASALEHVRKYVHP